MSKSAPMNPPTRQSSTTRSTFQAIHGNTGSKEASSADFDLIQLPDHGLTCPQFGQGIRRRRTVLRMCSQSLHAIALSKPPSERRTAWADSPSLPVIQNTTSSSRKVGTSARDTVLGRRLSTLDLWFSSARYVRSRSQYVPGGAWISSRTTESTIGMSRGLLRQRSFPAVTGASCPTRRFSSSNSVHAAPVGPKSVSPSQMSSSSGICSSSELTRSLVAI